MFGFCCFLSPAASVGIGVLGIVKGVKRKREKKGDGERDREKMSFAPRAPMEEAVALVRQMKILQAALGK